MRIDYSKTFDKQYARLTKHQKLLVRGAIEMFIDEPSNISLRNHPLKDEWSGYSSITADEDLRLHYKLLNDNTALFVAVGTHKELYK